MGLHNPRLVFLGLAFTSGLALAEACKSSHVNSNHCSFLDGDATCADRHEGALPYCGGDCIDSEHNDGCVMEVPVGCYYACGDDMLADMSCLGMTETNAGTLDSTGDPSGDPTTNTDSSSETETASVTSGETETTDPTGSTGPTGCQNSSECTNPMEPVCLDSLCVPCTDTPDGDTACMSKDANFPVCAEDGQCVQCNAANDAACGGTTPICDTGSSSCVACTYHEQCTESACRIATGECFDAADVYDVGMGQTYATLTAARDDLGDGVQVVLVLHDGADFNESIQLSGTGTAYAFLGAPGNDPQWGFINSGAPTLEVLVDAEAYVQDVRLTGNLSAEAIAVDGAGAWLDRAELVQNSGGGLVLTNAANAQMRTTIIGGDATSGLPALAIDSSSARILYTTAVGVGIGGQAVSCTDAGAVDIRNALLFTQDGTAPIDCAGATVSRTAAEIEIAGQDNVGVAGFMTSAFVNFGQSNFYLDGGAPASILTAARWRTADLAAVPPRPANDPATDINDQVRPDQDDAEDVAGADIP